MVKSVIVSGARTPFGKFGGSLSSLTASDLGGIAIKGALEKVALSPEEIDEVIMGTVLQGGQGQIPSRQAASKAGIPWSVKTETINKVCASGLRSITLADQLIRLGDESVIVAGGMESMSNAPYYLPNGRWGLRMGDAQLIDGMVYDGLSCAFDANHVHMGTYGNQTAAELNISREQQDRWAARSQERAVQSIEKGTFKEEIVAVNVPQRKGDDLIVEVDEAPRKGTTEDVLAKLKPAFGIDGSVTAGNAPGINDGACAVVVMSDEEAAKRNLTPLATVLGHAEVAIEPERFPQTPGLVINALLEKTGKKLEEVALFEINEAFAVVALASNQIAGLDEENVNVKL